jgi:hypothetical protein
MLTLGCAGLIVNTTADWDAAQQGFVLHTPDDGAVKNWISQVGVERLKSAKWRALSHACALARSVSTH